MDDLTTYAFLATSFFFVAVALGLLVRYRQASQRLNASTDLGRDLWWSLEQRLKKQDERILDVMGRMEVIQSRVLAGEIGQPTAPATAPQPPLAVADTTPPVVGPRAEPVMGTPEVQQPESQQSHGSQESQVQTPAVLPVLESKLDETQLAAIRLLADAPKNTRELTDALKKSREHTARIMKDLFVLGLVSRNDSSKPFVYQLTDAGRKALPPPT